MEKSQNLKTNAMQTNKAALWTGQIITVLCILFLLVDAGMKVVKATPSMEGSVQLGWPAEGVQAIGIILLLAPRYIPFHEPLFWALFS